MKILSWKDNFNKEILARGKQYYQSNRIGSFINLEIPIVQELTGQIAILLK